MMLIVLGNAKTGPFRIEQKNTSFRVKNQIKCGVNIVLAPSFAEGLLTAFYKAQLSHLHQTAAKSLYETLQEN